MNGFLWFFEVQINDGNGMVAGKRIYVVYQDDQSNVKQVSPSILWDLKPYNATSLQITPNEDLAVGFVVDNILPAYLEELRKQREHDAEIKRKYGIRSLQELILKSEEKLIDYETRKAKGEHIPDVVIQNEMRRKEDLKRRKIELERQIEGEINLLPSPPKIIGVAAVLPMGPEDDVLKEDKEIEEIGMRIAMEFEISQGRIPEDVSAQNLGFDIRSKAPDGSYRYIEVKARAREGKIALTPNEWLMAHRLGNEYWLYVVVNASTNPELYTIQNPAEKLKPEEEIKIVRYIVKDWKNVATKESVGG